MHRSAMPFLITMAVVLLTVFGPPAPASAVDPFLAPHFGTLGVGIDQGFIFTPQIKGRLTGNTIRVYIRDASISDVDYDLAVDLFTFGGLVDFHPNAGPFRLTAGVLYNGSRIDMEGSIKLRESVEIGPIRITGSVIGDLDGDAVYDPFAPYFGFGWGTGNENGRRWEYSFDAGLLYLGRAHVSLRAPLAVVDSLAEAVEEEEDDIERELNRYRFYPVLRFGVSYRF